MTEVSRAVMAHIRAANERSVTLDDEYRAQTSAMRFAKTEEDWQACLDAFGERVVGIYLCQNYDEDSSDGMGNGDAYLKVGLTQAICVHWEQDGTYDVSIVPIEDAVAAMEGCRSDHAEMLEEEG